MRSVQLESACSLAALGQGCDTGGTCIAWDNYGSWGSFVEVEVDDWESGSEPDIVCLDDHSVHGLHVPLVPSTTSGSGSVGAPPREESGLELCEVSPKVPTPVLVDAGISDMPPLPEPPVLKDVTNATGPTQDDHGEYKYHVPEQPSFANEVAKMVAEASLPDFSKQGKPRGRKTRTSEAIADEVGDDSDDEKPTKPSPEKTSTKDIGSKGEKQGKPPARQQPNPRRKPNPGRKKHRMSRVQRVARASLQNKMMNPLGQRRSKIQGQLGWQRQTTRMGRPPHHQGVVPALTCQLMRGQHHLTLPSTMFIRILTDML